MATAIKRGKCKFRRSGLPWYSRVSGTPRVPMGSVVNIVFHLKRMSDLSPLTKNLLSNPNPGLKNETSITHITLSEDPLSFPKGHHLPPDAGG
jgi:hypothetical protein